MKRNIIKKLFIQIARKLGLELIEQSNLKFINEKDNSKSIVVPLGKVKLTRKVSDLLVIFRTNIDILIWDQNKKRIFEADKLEYSKRSLTSLIKSINLLSSLRNDINIKLLIVNNSKKSANNDEFKKLINKISFDYEIINHQNEEFKDRIQHNNNEETFGNLSSLLKCYEIAKLEAKDLVYFVEDDYIHEAHCLLEMVETYERISSQLNKEIFVCPSDYPYLYNDIDQSKIFAGSNRHWRTINRVLCTFLVSKDHLLEYWENFTNTCLSRNDPFEKHINEIFYRELCLSPMKSLAIHITNVNSSYGLSPFIDYKKLWEENENI